MSDTVSLTEYTRVVEENGRLKEQLALNRKFSSVGYCRVVLEEFKKKYLEPMMQMSLSNRADIEKAYLRFLNEPPECYRQLSTEINNQLRLIPMVNTTAVMKITYIYARYSKLLHALNIMGGFHELSDDEALLLVHAMPDLGDSDRKLVSILKNYVHFPQAE